MDENKESVAQDNEQASTQEQPTTEKTFTQEEVNNFIAKERKQWEKKAQAEKEEAKQLAKMNAEEKANYELEKRQKALEDREQVLQRKELQAEAKNILNEKGLPIELFELLPYENAETVKKGIDILEQAIQKAVQNAVEQRLKGNAPRTSTNSGNDLEAEIRKHMGIK